MMMKKLLALLPVFLLFASCAANEASPSPSPAEPGYLFVSGGVSIQMGEPAEEYISALGEPFSVFEAPSCAFDGIDRIYHYPGFDLYTFPKDGVDYVLSVTLTDDSLSTPEGIYLGLAESAAAAAYGDGFTVNGNEITYSKGAATLSFIIEDGDIAAITYRYANA